MKPRNLPDFLTYIETLYPSSMELGLERICKVYHRIPKLNQCKVITVGGTNGKGSTVEALSFLVQQNGLRVGAYTSPHLYRFNERIRVNGVEIDDLSLFNAFQIVDTLRDDIPLTFFEFTTLAALVYFAEQDLDVVILEVGLGGRLDAVNIVEPDITIITRIAKDHMEYLGDTLESIAKEKAGILRANKPIIYGDEATADLIKPHADKIGAQLYLAKPTSDDTHLHPSNLGCALKAAELLGWNVNSDTLGGLKSLTLPCRYQKRFENNRVIISDVAHNLDAIENLANRLKQEQYQQLHVVIGMMKDKDIEAVLKPLHDLNPQYYCVTLAPPRGETAENLATRMGYFGRLSCYENPTQAYQDATYNSSEGDVIVCTGSFYLFEELPGNLPTN